MTVRHNPLIDIPVTRAGLTYIERRLADRGFSPAQINAAVRLWTDAHAGEGSVAKARRDLFARRIEGAPGADELEVTFDDGGQELSVRTRSSSPRPLRMRGQAPMSEKQHADELASMAVQHVVEVPSGVEGAEPFYKTVLAPRHATLTNRAITGNVDALVELGIASVRTFLFPVAYVEADVSRDPASGALGRIELAVKVPVDTTFDAVGALNSLRLEGLLPLASEEDVLRFLMAMASPLLREKLAGLLGIYWFTGESGSGKDLLVSMLRVIWESVGAQSERALVPLTCIESEARKTFAQSPDAPYVHLEEAGKQPGGIDFLIRLSGSSLIPARGLYRPEVYLRNTFTYLASSVESPADRREISRRSVVIRTVKQAAGIDGPKALARIRELAPQLIGSLLHAITEAGSSALEQRDPGGRPHAILVLAEICGATLDPVVGESLDDMYRAMKAYTETERLRQGGRARPAKGASFLERHPAYRSAHFVETMQREVGYAEYFRQLKHGKFVYERIQREMPTPALRGIGADYATVVLDGVEYGLRFVGSRHDVFSFFPLTRVPNPPAIDPPFPPRQVL